VSIYDVLKRPFVTEKSTLLKDNRQLVVEVQPWANKLMIKEAAEKLFGIKVAAVRTAITRGKVKRVGARTGKQSNVKKAILSLKEGSDVDVFGAVGSEVPQAAE
jgi:large subunit ribosomal protein L23